MSTKWHLNSKNEIKPCKAKDNNCPFGKQFVSNNEILSILHNLPKTDSIYVNNGIIFIWNNEKYLTNINKHKITFEEASTVLDNPNSTPRYDEINSTQTEIRYKTIGFSSRLNILLVCNCVHEHTNIYRIYSAREAEKHEVDLYRKNKW